MVEDLIAHVQGYGIPVVAVVLASLLDMAFGFGAAVLNKEVSSSKMREGIARKLGILGLVVVAIFVELGTCYVGLPVNVPVVGGVAAWLVLMELISVCETLTKLNPELASSPLLSVLKCAFDSVDEKKENHV